MKKGKIWALAALCASVVLSAGTAAACNKHTHEYGDWTFTTAPTEDAEGTATHTCVDGDHTEEITVAKLTDTSVWTLTTVDATHDNAGKKSYTSEYGTVEIAIPKGEHTYDGAEWKITAAPTLDAAGKAERKCTANDSGVESVDIPALTNEIWTADVKSAPTHTNEGLTVYTSVYGSVNYITAKLAAHEYGAWSITEKPTLTDGGKAVRYCIAEDEASDEKVLPALSDTEFWSYSVITPASHVANGKGEYTSDYGKVEVEIPAEPHTYDGAAWTITVKPTLTVGGKAERECTANDGGLDRVDIPELTDADVWTRDEATYVAPTDDTPGRATYNSVYGSVTVVLARLKEPYFNKTYYNFVYNNGADYKDKALNKIVSWDAAELPIDGKGEGMGSAYPYSGAVTITTTDFDTNKIEFTRDGSKYVGYADFETGVLVIFDTTYLYVLTPYSYDEEYSSTDEDTGETTTKTVKHAVSDAKASAWTFTNAGGIASSAMAIAYNYAEDKVLNIYIDDAGAVHFNVTFTDMSGKAVAADECYKGAQYLYVKDADGELIASFGNVFGDGMHVLDGLEGVTYTCEGKDFIQLSGYGHIMFGNNNDNVTATGKYTIVDGKLHAYVGNGMDFENFDRFYIITLDTENKTYTSEIPNVILRLNYGEYSTENVLDWNLNMYVPFTLPAPTATDDTKIFTGWYTDAACENPVELDKDGKYIPKSNANLYAGWAVKVNIFYVLEDGGSQIKLEYAVGEVLDSKLPELGIEVDKNRYFAGWFFENGTPVTTNAELAEGDNNLVVYAKWNEIPAYYGEYEGKQMLVGGAVYEATLTIDINGNMTGIADHGYYTVSLNGKVLGYSAESQELSWQPENGAATYTMWLDAESGLMVIPADIGDTEMDTYPFVVSKNGAIGENQAFGIHNGANSRQGKTKLFAYGDKLALIYSDKIYGDVTISDAFGNALSLDTVMASKTLVVNKEGNVIVAFGTNATTFSSDRDEFGKFAELKLLDAYYGVYSAGNENYKLDGLGNITWTVGGDEHTGIYSYAETKDGYDVFGVYERERRVDTSTSTDDDGDEVITTTISYKNVAYYELKLSKSGGAHVWTKPMVTVSFAVADGSNTDANIPSVDAIEVNKNIAIGLETPANTSDSIFWGWYTDANHTNEVDLENYIPVADATLYAWWRGKITVTVKYNDGTTADGAVDILPGSTATVEKPAYAGHRFIGWYTDAACTDGNEWVSGETVVNDSLDIYAKWGDPHVLFGAYKGFDFDNASSSSSTSFTYSLTINEDGTIKNSRGDSYGGDPEGFDEENGGAFIVGNRYSYFDKASGLIGIAYGATTKICFNNDVILYSTRNPKKAEWSCKLDIDNDGKLTSGRLLIFTFEDNSTQMLYVDNERIFGDVTVEAFDMSGVAVESFTMGQFTAANILNFTVKDSSGAVIVELASSGSEFKPNDGTDGTFTCADKDNLILSGAGAFVWGDKSGEYTAVDGVENSFVLNVKENNAVVSSYKAVISDGAYTATENKVTITYVSEHSTHESAEVWANVAHTLPVPAFEGYHLVGWYIEGAEDTVYDTEYVPSANVTFIAKWVIPVAMHGSYIGFETYGSSANGTSVSGGSSGSSLTVDALGNVKGYIGGSGQTGNVTTDYDPTTGLFTVTKTSNNNKYLAYYDAENGIIAGLYTSGGEKIGYDFYVLFKGATSANGTNGSQWLGGYARLIDVTLTGRAESSMKIFVLNNKLYANVTWTTTDTEDDEVTKKVYAAKEVYKAKQLTILDSNGQEIASFGKVGSGLMQIDGYQGTYSGSFGEIVLDGFGNLTIGSNTVAYTVLDGGNIHFVSDNATRVISLGDGAYTQVQDGYAGTYTLPDGAGTVTLDGLGGAGDNATYVVDGTNISIYIGDDVANYGIDVDKKALLGKSVFAGLTFTGNSITLSFTDEAAINGSLKYGLYVYGFKGTFDASTNILTIEITTQNYNMGKIGKIITANVSNGKITFTTDFRIDFSGDTGGTSINGKDVTCDGFSL